MSRVTPTREIIIEMVPNEDYFMIWSREEPEMVENEEIYMVWNDNDTYRKE